MKKTKSARSLPPPLRGLTEMAHDLRWSWEPKATALWEELARRVSLPDGSTAPLNPVRVLGKLALRPLDALCRDRDFLRRLSEARVALYSHRSAASGGPFSTKRPVAYLSMEFAIHSSLPFYAGGLGVLAGDHLKSSSDLGLPLVGIGLSYRNGYYRQEVGARGKMEVRYPRSRYEELPLELVRDDRGKEIRLRVDVAGRRAELRAWRIRVGRVSLFLLDSDFDANAPRERALCRHLYGGTREDRIRQEILAGIGGVRLLRSLGLQPRVWHLNEGHVALCTLERLRELRRGRRAMSFEAAVETVAADTVFTTHTPVPEGNEVFDLDLARRHLAPLCRAAGIDVDAYLSLGLDRAPSGKPVLSMTVLAMRLSRIRNGVSRLHGVVSRRMWRHLWPGFSAEELPITSITNGVHASTWVAPEMDDLLARHVAPNWRERLDDPLTWKRSHGIPNRELWSTRQCLRKRLVDFVRLRSAAALRRNGKSERQIARATEGLLDPEAFTIGFARRFALYKRAALLFEDRTKALKLFRSPRRPVQILFAGKPHPEDPLGKQLYERVVSISRRRDFRGRVVVLENYDMDVGRALVQGVDLWLNNPRRPLEASGTSGQKAPLNGGLNASILDGWWDEAYRSGAGWAIGSRREAGRNLKRQDRDDCAALHRVLAGEVVPLFYDRRRDGIPHRWLRCVKKSMEAFIPVFNTDHMVQQYRERLYEPAAELGHRFHRQAALADELVAWKHRIRRCWPLVHLLKASWRGSSSRQMLEVDIFAGGIELTDLRARAWKRSKAPSTEPAPCFDGAGREIDEGVLRYRFALPRPRKAPIRVRLWPQHVALAHPHETGLSFEVDV